MLEGENKTSAKIITLAGYELGDENTFDEPDKISPKEDFAALTDNKLQYEFKPHSVTIIKFS